MNVAVIPARGGSKRIPKKNIRLFYNKPIIAYSIELAKRSGLFDLIIVSTDSEEIASISRQYGAEIPFKRPAELSDDQAGTTEVLIHAETYLQQEAGYSIDYLCCIYPTAPLLTEEYLKAGYNALKKNKVFNIAFSSAKYSYPVLRSFYLGSDSSPDMLFPENYYKNSQELRDVYHDAGQFYWWRFGKLTDGKILFGSDSFAVILPEILVQDIDTEEDWQMTEYKYGFLRNAIKEDQ